jgi:hypothetical protein
MKRLLLLFIPLIFFFGCEEEESDCSCGVVIDQVFIPAFTGIEDFDNNQWTIIEAHDDYTVSYIENDCDGTIGLTYEETVVGESFCLNEQYVWSEIILNTQVNKNCDNTSIDENNRCGIILDIIFFEEPSIVGLGGVQLILENCFTNKIGTACVTIYNEEDWDIYNVGEVYCPEWVSQIFWNESIPYYDTSGGFQTYPGCDYYTDTYLSFIWPDN